MGFWYIAFVVLFALALVVSCIKSYIKARRQRRIDIVKEYSLAYLRVVEKRDELIGLSKRLPDDVKIYVSRKSLQSFRNYMPDRDVRKYIAENLSEAYLSEICGKLDRNKELQVEFALFKSKLDMSGSDLDWEDAKAKMRMSYDMFLKIQSELLAGLNLDCIPVTWSLFVEVSYISPGGRSRNFNSWSYSAERLLSMAGSVRSSQDVKSYERNKMTAKLRYQVLREDGFRCQICGRSVDDGVTLEVDHILPVSKGGKTVRENLRTLCHDCNQGKKDRYFAGELN